MEIIGLRPRPNLSENARLSRPYAQFQTLLEELRGRGLPPDIIAAINTNLKALNATADNPSELRSALQKHQSQILSSLRQNLGLVPKNHYTKRWLALGMSAFGIPAGVVFGLAIKNIAMLSVGLPFGMGVGSVLGRRMDKKARDEGRQLEIEIK